MKQTLLLISLFLLNLTSSAQSKNTYEDKIHDLITDSFNEMWSEMDSSKILKFHTKDFLLLENGVVWTNDSISNNFSTTLLREKVIPKRSNKITFIDTKILNSMAWVAYHNYAVWAIGEKIYGKAHWLESAIAIKTDNGWKIQMLHSTRIKD
jgi:hypothetical protein